MLKTPHLIKQLNHLVTLIRDAVYQHEALIAEKAKLRPIGLIPENLTAATAYLEAANQHADAATAAAQKANEESEKLVQQLDELKPQTLLNYIQNYMDKLYNRL